MNGETLRWPLVFVLVVLVCGGGCMMAPFMGQRMEDLAYVGLDEHTRARLRGEVDPRPNDPEPVAHLSGKLLLYQLQIPRARYNYSYGRAPSQIATENAEKLEQLGGIESIGYLALQWDFPGRETEYSDEPLVTPAEFRQALLGAAQVRDGDLILVYTAQDSSDSYDPMFSLASILTLGHAPTKVVTVDRAIEAALIDAHSGFIYAATSGKGDGWRLTNFWNRESDKYPASVDAGKEAFEDLLKKLTEAWPTMKQVYQ